MNRSEFLNSFFAMYGKSFTDTNKQIWLDAYKKVLPESIDFDLLYETLLTDYDGKTAPTPAWLKKNAKVKQEISDTPLEFKNIYATAPNGIEYMFSYITSESNYALECENLLKQGFTNFRKA